MENLPIFELIIQDEDFDNLYAISLVDEPAIESDFMLFEKNTPLQLQKVDMEKRVITGAVLIPNKKIYRRNELGDEFEVFFSKDTITKLMKNYLKNHKQDSVTLQHQINANKVYIFESWQIEDSKNDKAVALGFEELPVGTWMVSMQVDNDEILQSIIDGDANGFSIEGFLSSVQVKAEKETLDEKNVAEKLNEILDSNKSNDEKKSQIKDFLKQFDEE